MKKFTLVKVPKEATEIFINNVGCLRYSYNEGKESTAIEPMQIGVYLEKDKHNIIGDSFFDGERYVIIEINNNEL